MKRLIKQGFSLIMASIFLLLIACDSQSSIYSEMSSEDSSEGISLEAVESSEVQEMEENKLSGTLRIYTSQTAYPYTHLSQAADIFKKLNPDVNIEIIGPEKLGVVDTNSSEFALNLAANNIGDIVNTAGFDIAKFYREGVFIDLKEYLEYDSEINLEDYYENIFKSWEVDGALPFIAPVIRTYCFRLNNSIINNLGVDISDKDRISCGELVDIYNLADEMGIAEKYKITGGEIATTFDIEDYLTVIGRNTDFQGDNLESIFSNSKLINNMVPSTSAIMVNPFSDDTTITINELARLYIPSATKMNMTRYFDEGEYYSKALVYTLNSGEILYSVSSMFSIPSSSNNKELAWKFLKFLISDIDFGERLKLGLYEDGFLINKDANRKLFAYGLGSNGDDIYEKTEEILSQISKPKIISSEFNASSESIANLIDKNNSGQISPSQAAEEFELMVETYFSE